VPPPHGLLELVPANAPLPFRLVRPGAAALELLVVHDGRSRALEAELAALVHSALTQAGVSGLGLVVRSLEPARALLEAQGLDGPTQARLLEDPAAFEVTASSPELPLEPVGDDIADPAKLERVLLAFLARLRFRTYGTRTPEEVATRLAGRLTATLPAVARRIQQARAVLLEIATLDGRPSRTISEAGEILSRHKARGSALAETAELLIALERLGLPPVRLELSYRSGAAPVTTDPAWTLQAIDAGTVAQGGAVVVPTGRAAFATVDLTRVSQSSVRTPRIAPDVLIVPVSSQELAAAHLLAVETRRCGVRAELDPSGRNLKSSLRSASRRGIAFVAIVGEREAREGTVVLKDLERHAQEAIPRERFAATFVALSRREPVQGGSP
jgi:hypothetical protein